MCTLYISVEDKKTTLGVIPQVPYTFFFLPSFLSSISNGGGDGGALTGTHCVEEAVWPASPRDQCVSASPELGLHVLCRCACVIFCFICFLFLNVGSEDKLRSLLYGIFPAPVRLS